MHAGFYGLAEFLSRASVDIACVQEVAAPVDATLPSDQPYRYIGPSDTGGADSAMLVRGAVADHCTAPRGTAPARDICWQILSHAPGSRDTAVCSFYAPSVGSPAHVREDFWAILAASARHVRGVCPHADLVLCGDANLHLPEIMGPGSARPHERHLCDALRALCAELDLRIVTPAHVPTHRNGHSLDIVLLSGGLEALDLHVHGPACACPSSDVCCPLVGSDHYAITFSLFKPVLAPPPTAVPAWPARVDWPAVIPRARAQLESWLPQAASVGRLLRANPALACRRAGLDVLFTRLVQIVWKADGRAARAPPARPRRPGRTQPRWWDAACRDALVARNAAFRALRRCDSASNRLRHAAARRAFHRIVRRAKAAHWAHWSAAVSSAPPRAAARMVRSQFSSRASALPASMDASHLPQSAQTSLPEAWAAHFAAASATATPDFDDRHLARVRRRVRRLWLAMASVQGRYDAPFSEAELAAALASLPSHRAPGIDGLPYEALAVDDPVWRRALLALFNLVLEARCCPSAWKFAVVCPVFKSGARSAFDNYRPIALLCTSLKLFERLLVNRFGTAVYASMDPAQAGFRWGADLQAYTLAEVLHLRGRARTFCAFVDIRKAFDVTWRDAVLLRLHRAGVDGAAWALIADLLSGPRAAALAHGTLSRPWVDTNGVRQGSVLSTILFNLVIDSLAPCIRRACPGVALGPSPGAPRCTLLLYADDLVILAETPQALQAALEAISRWARLWRFTFGIGPSKSAVLIVNPPRVLPEPFLLAGSALPFVDWYCYLGVAFASRRTWHAHLQLVQRRGNQRIASAVAWAAGEGLDLSVMDFLAGRFVLPSALYGCEFLSGPALSGLDRCLRGWGRRLLRWPAGAPNFAVLGTLGWWDAQTRMLYRAASLVGRLLTLPHGDTSVVAFVAAHARAQPRSWLSTTLAALSAVGVPGPSEWGVGPGAPRGVAARWCHVGARRALGAHFQRHYRAGLAALPSLHSFATWVPTPVLDRRVHNRRIHAAAAREWTLARCGHHPFTDGRASRHAAQSHGVCPCGASADTFLHAVRSCPLHAPARTAWALRLALPAGFVSRECDAALLRVLFDTAPPVPAGRVRANVAFVASLCSVRRSLG